MTEDRSAVDPTDDMACLAGKRNPRDIADAVSALLMEGDLAVSFSEISELVEAKPDERGTTFARARRAVRHPFSWARQLSWPQTSIQDELLA